MSEQATSTGLCVDYCTAQAARWACERWHYSKTVPVGKTVKCGVWFDGAFRGCVIFSLGAKAQHVQFGLNNTEVCELARVALTDHPEFTVTQVVARALKLLKRKCPGMRLVVSFADTTEGHHGGIYQAGNWIYSGKSAETRGWVYKGRKLHIRAYSGQNFGRPRMPLPAGAKAVRWPGKHRYLMPLDKRMRRAVKRLAQPYPERSTGDADAQ